MTSTKIISGIRILKNSTGKSVQKSMAKKMNRGTYIVLTQNIETSHTHLAYGSAYQILEAT